MSLSFLQLKWLQRVAEGDVASFYSGTELPYTGRITYRGLRGPHGHHTFWYILTDTRKLVRWQPAHLNYFKAELTALGKEALDYAKAKG
jgi:hypothetical protein